LDRLTLADVSLGSGVSVPLDLRRRDIFADQAIIVASTPAGAWVLPRPPVALFGGKIVARDDSTVFLSFSPFGVYGFVRLGGEEYVISSGVAVSGQPAVTFNPVRLPAGTIQWQEWACHADELPTPPGLTLPLGAARAGGTRGGACRLADIAIETDYEFTASLFGGNTAAATAYVATLIGAVSEIYQRDVNARLEGSYLRLWTAADDPWTQGDTSARIIHPLHEFSFKPGPFRCVKRG
jgi:hypothetical protein